MADNTIKLPSLDLQTIIRTVTKSRYHLVDHQWLTNGEQIKLNNGAVVVRYNTGTVVIQGKNADEIIPLLHRKAKQIAKKAAANANKIGRRGGAKTKKQVAGQNKAGSERAATQ